MRLGQEKKAEALVVSEWHKTHLWVARYAQMEYGLSTNEGSKAIRWFAATCCWDQGEAQPPSATSGKQPSLYTADFVF